jgi:glutamine synthetase
MSETMRQYMAGLIAYAPDYTFFLAPYINSYKRFQAGTFAPTKTIWSVDNRTAGYRLCGEGTKACASSAASAARTSTPISPRRAAGRRHQAGIEDKMELEPPEFRGDVYDDADAARSPSTLRAATETLRARKCCAPPSGDDVVDHYVHAPSGSRKSSTRVTDWEIARGFERS